MFKNLKYVDLKDQTRLLKLESETTYSVKSRNAQLMYHVPLCQRYSKAILLVKIPLKIWSNKPGSLVSDALRKTS